MTTPAPSTVQTVYLDSCVLIAAVSHESPEVREELRALFDQINSGRISAVVSTFTIAEVRQFKRDLDLVPMTDDEVRAVRNMLASPRLIKRPVTEKIAMRAAEIGNLYPEIMPGDAIHIATAEQFGVDALFTFDGSSKVGRRKPSKMLAHDRQIGGLRIMEAFNPLGGIFDAPKMQNEDVVPNA